MGIIWIHNNAKSKKRTMTGEREEEELGTGMPEFVLIKKEVQQLELTHFLPNFFFFFADSYHIIMLSNLYCKVISTLTKYNCSYSQSSMNYLSSAVK